MILAVSSSIIVQVIEIGFIGQLGTVPVAAVTFTFPLTMALSSVALGISIGCSSVIARRVGSGDWDAVRRLASHGFVLVASVTSILAVAGWLAIDAAFAALGASAEALDLIHSYLNVYFPGAVLFTLTMVAGSIVRATGNARVPGLLMTCGAFLNLALDPLLIFGWFGFPRLELAGAAWAMLISRLITGAAMIYYVTVHERLVMQMSGWTEGLLRSWREILQVGVPAIATQLIGPVSGAVITRLLAEHGETVVAGFGVATRIEAVALMVLFALSGSIGPFVGQNHGALKHDRVRQGMRAVYAFCLCWGVIACSALWLSAAYLIPLIDDHPGVVAAASRYLLIVPISYGLWGVLMMSSAAFNSLGKPLPSTMMSFVRMFVLYVPLALLGNHLWGYVGIFIATAASNCIMGGVGYMWLSRSYALRDT
jgi:putative MATE family efflux protein